MNRYSRLQVRPSWRIPCGRRQTRQRPRLDRRGTPVQRLHAADRRQGVGDNGVRSIRDDSAPADRILNEQDAMERRGEGSQPSPTQSPPIREKSGSAGFYREDEGVIGGQLIALRRRRSQPMPTVARPTTKIGSAAGSGTTLLLD